MSCFKERLILIIGSSGIWKQPLNPNNQESASLQKHDKYAYKMKLQLKPVQVNIDIQVQKRSYFMNNIGNETLSKVLDMCDRTFK